MRKKLTTLTALLLALLLLAGCGLPWPPARGDDSPDLSSRIADPLEAVAEKLFGQYLTSLSTDDEHNPDGLMFSEMRYERPDTDAIAAAVQRVTDALDAGEPLETVEALLDASLELRSRFSTMLVLADIHNCRDLTDGSFAAEYEWISAEDAVVSQLFNDLYYACAASSLGAELEEDYFWPGFCEDYADPDDSWYNDESVALMQRESELIGRYRSLMADPTILFEGREQSFNELMAEYSSEILSFSAYFRYRSILRTFYESYSEELAELYVELLRVHIGMAEAMGFGSVEEMEYAYSFQRDYTPAETAVFLGEVKRTIVPIYRWTEERGIRYDSFSSPMSGEKLYWSMKELSEQLGGDCAEAFGFMSRYGLYDIEESTRKADVSFECYLDAYESPFLFLNPSGTSADLMSFVHEFGHYTEAYVNFGASEPLDLAEVFSQGLEFLSLSRLDDVLPADEAGALRDAQLYDAMLTFVYQCAYAEFERRVHALSPDEISVETLNAIALDTAKEYGMYSRSVEDLLQYFWMDIPHFYEMPFYVISYPVSLSVALQFYELELSESGRGLDKYFEVLPRNDEGFVDTVVNGGMTLPFDVGALDGTAALFAEAFGYDAAAEAA